MLRERTIDLTRDRTIDQMNVLMKDLMRDREKNLTMKAIVARLPAKRLDQRPEKNRASSLSAGPAVVPGETRLSGIQTLCMG